MVKVAIGIVVRDGQVLICQRRQSDAFGGYWEFPGGKCEPGETPEDCVRRELREELEIEVTALRGLDVIKHEYPSGAVALYPFVCRLDAGRPRPISACEMAWVSVQALSQYRFPEANAGLIDRLGIDLAWVEA